MHIAPYVLAGLSAGLSATASSVQAAGDHPGYGMKPDHRNHSTRSYPVYGKKPDYPEKAAYGYSKKPDYDEGYGHATVVNFCPFDVYLWSVAWDTDGPYTIGCRQEYVEKYLKGGVALEVVTDKDSWDKDQDKLILYYKKSRYEKKVDYDLYERHGSPFEGHKVSLKPEEDYCPAEYWDDGCAVDDGGKKTCDDFADLVVYLCEEYKDKYPDSSRYYGRSGLPKLSPSRLASRGNSSRVRSVNGNQTSYDHWDQDKPSWDTDAKCVDCGERVKGSIADLG